MTYTADFRQLVGPLNAIGAKMTQPLTVEIYPAGRMRPPVWKARVTSPAAYLMEMTFPQTPRDPRYCQKLVEQLFEEMISEKWHEHPGEEDSTEAHRQAFNEKPIWNPRARKNYGMGSF